VVTGMKGQEAAVITRIAKDSRVMRKATCEDRRSRWAAERVRDEIIDERRAILLHLQNMGHVLHQVQR
jgi:hypothetical protein